MEGDNKIKAEEARFNKEIIRFNSNRTFISVAFICLFLGRLFRSCQPLLASRLFVVRCRDAVPFLPFSCFKGRMTNVMRIIKIVGGLALGLLLCWGLIVRLNIQPADALRLMTQLSWPSVVGVFLLTGLMAWTGAHKWSLWAQAFAGPSPEKTETPNYLRHMIWQSWIGQFVPPSLAVIVGRGMAERHGASFRQGALSGVYDQAMEFLFLSAMLVASVAVLWFKKDFLTFVVLSLLGWAMAYGLVYLIARKVRPFLCFYLPRLMLWSMVRVALTVARLVLGAPALGLSIDLLSIAAASSVVALLALIPLTPGNLGIAEWGWVGVLSFAGNDAFQAGLLALGFRVLVLVVQTLLLMGYEAYVLCRRH